MSWIVRLMRISLLSYHNLARIPSCLKYANLSNVISLTDAHLLFCQCPMLELGERGGTNPASLIVVANSSFSILMASSTPFWPLYCFDVNPLVQRGGGLFLISYRETPYRYPANENMIRTKSDCLEYVRSLAHTPVHCDLYLPLGKKRADTERVKRCGNAIELPSAVIGNDNAIQAVINCHLNIIGRVD